MANIAARASIDEHKGEAIFTACHLRDMSGKASDDDAEDDSA
jgi:hypothetical protein